MSIKGMGVSPGKALGSALLFPELKYGSLCEESDIAEPQAEMHKFTEAVERLSSIYNATVQQLFDLGKNEQAKIIKMHGSVLNDCLFKEFVELNITKRISASKSVLLFVEDQEKTFGAIHNPYIKERIYDIKDVAQRLIYMLEGVEYPDLASLDYPVILFAEEISPSLMVNLNTQYVKGVVTQKGSMTSHAGILARSMELPAVMGCGFGGISNGDKVYIDGEKGIVEVFSAVADLTPYIQLIEEDKADRKMCEQFYNKPTVTSDGKEVKLYANIMDVKLMDAAIKVGAEGVGLYRTELLYLDRTALPSENEQFEIYKTLAEKMADKPVIIRTMDIGGDKEAPCIRMDPEPNPFLGCRGIRLSLEKTEIFKTQLKAIVRACRYGKVNIMFPMISCVDELIYARGFVEQSEFYGELTKNNNSPDIGIMVEVPSAVVMIDTLLKYADFVSIGSNDLTQYTLAADRFNSKTADLCSHFNPAVIKMIKLTIDAAKRAGKPCGLCGEMASDPLAIPLLIGLGLEEFSVNTSALLKTRKLISETDFARARLIAQKCLGLEATNQVIDSLKEMKGERL